MVNTGYYSQVITTPQYICNSNYFKILISVLYKIQSSTLPDCLLCMSSIQVLGLTVIQHNDNTGHWINVTLVRSYKTFYLSVLHNQIRYVSNANNQIQYVSNANTTGNTRMAIFCQKWPFQMSCSIFQEFFCYSCIKYHHYQSFGSTHIKGMRLFN